MDTKSSKCVHLVGGGTNGSQDTNMAPMGKTSLGRVIHARKRQRTSFTNLETHGDGSGYLACDTCSSGVPKEIVPAGIVPIGNIPVGNNIGFQTRTKGTTPANAARTSATTATVRGAARQAGDGAGDGIPAHERCTGASCTLVLCVLGDLRVASGCASGCEPRVLRVLRVPHVFFLVPLGLPLEVGCMFHACSVFCSIQSKRSRRSRPRQWIHRRSRRQPRKRALGRQRAMRKWDRSPRRKPQRREGRWRRRTR